MPNRSKEKGDRLERQVVKALNAGGIQAERVPLSGAAGGSFGGDIVAMIPSRNYPHDPSLKKIELKKRGDGFKQIYSWLEGNDALVIAADRKPPLVVIPLADWIAMIGGGE